MKSMTMVRKLRRMGIQGLLVLVAVSLMTAVASLYLRSREPGKGTAADSGRQRALLQASELLISPAVSPHVPRPQLIQQAEYQYSSADPGAIPKREIHGASRGKTPSAEASRAAGPSWPPTPAATASAPSSPAAMTTASQPPRRQFRKIIPSSIEDGLPTASAGDPLSGITISSTMRSSGSAAPQETATANPAKKRTGDLTR